MERWAITYSWQVSLRAANRSSKASSKNTRRIPTTSHLRPLITTWPLLNPMKIYHKSTRLQSHLISFLNCKPLLLRWTDSVTPSICQPQRLKHQTIQWEWAKMMSPRRTLSVNPLPSTCMSLVLLSLRVTVWKEVSKLTWINGGSGTFYGEDKRSTLIVRA